MVDITEEERQTLYEGFETTKLLHAVDCIDTARRHLADSEPCRPPQIRIDFMKLHELAMDVINKGWTDQVQELFDLAGDLEMQVFDMIEALESVQLILDDLMQLYPESLSYVTE